MKKGGFYWTKLLSNDKEILKYLSQDDLSANCQSVNLDINKIPLESALGISWNQDNDTIKVKVVKKSFSSSKWGLLSFSSSVIDPFGLLTPSNLSKINLTTTVETLFRLGWRNTIELKKLLVKMATNLMKCWKS